ncbi:MAG TPA: hypothetical protein VM513_24925 [Kofleriaceae bacterium]|jgi:hypothetical protein|nr:hypothetical protein [Kofleriaceae bacterium]
MESPARASEIELLLGDVNPSVIARILETGASIAEVDEALRATEDEDAFGEQPHTPSTSRVAEVRAILEEVAIEDARLVDEDAVTRP